MDASHFFGMYCLRGLQKLESASTAAQNKYNPDDGTASVVSTSAAKTAKAVIAATGAQEQQDNDPNASVVV